MNELWNDYLMERFTFEGMDAIVVFPKEGKAIGRLAIKTEYWDAFPATEIALLERGFHLCYIKNESRFALDDDVDRKARFVCYVAAKFGLQRRVVPVGMSCGGLWAIKFAARHPELVSCLYLDAPVLNYMSWPCGFGTATVGIANGQIEEALAAHHMSSISELINYREMPLDKIPQLLACKVPVVMVAGGSDLTVPYHENGIYLQKAYEDAGLEIEIYIKPECDHHPHGLEDVTPVVDFIMKH